MPRLTWLWMRRFQGEGVGCIGRGKRMALCWFMLFVARALGTFLKFALDL